MGKVEPIPSPPIDKMALWHAVEKTDPSHTKKVNQRGGFTAISAHYQIMRATEQFGPVGMGWGYESGAPIFHEGLVFVPVTIWHGDPSNVFGPLYGGAEWKNGKGFLDSDALKKATTDGLTKGLSQLGFNADVFLGLFDDNKYVAAMAEEFAPKPEPEAQRKAPVKLAGPYASKSALWAAVKAFDREVRGCGDYDTLLALLATSETIALMAQVERDAPQLAHGSDDLPAEFEPLHALIARTKTDLEAASRDDSWKRDVTRAG